MIPSYQDFSQKFQTLIRLFSKRCQFSHLQLHTLSKLPSGEMTDLYRHTLDSAAAYNDLVVMQLG